MLMQGVNVSRSNCDRICRTTSEGGLAHIVFGSYALTLLQPAEVSVHGGQHQPHHHFAF